MAQCNIHCGSCVVETRICTWRVQDKIDCPVVTPLGRHVMPLIYGAGQQPYKTACPISTRTCYFAPRRTSSQLYIHYSRDTEQIAGWKKNWNHCRRFDAARISNGQLFATFRINTFYTRYRILITPSSFMKKQTNLY